MHCPLVTAAPSRVIHMEFDMDRKDFRSLLSTLSGLSRNRASERSGPSALLASVGRAMGLNAASRNATLETLEGRALLEGSFANSILLTPDVSGHAISVVGNGA